MNLVNSLQKVKRIYKTQGIKILTKKIIRKLNKSYNYAVSYHKWIKENESAVLAKSLTNLKIKISIIVPTYNVADKWLIKCIDSILAQTYTNFELILVDDCSTKYNSREIIKAYAKKDERIKFHFNDKNLHISESTNVGIGMVTGEYITFVDNDDEISPNALAKFIKNLREYPDTTFAYSDEDLIDENGNRSNPVFKPDWSPYLTMSEMYTTHMAFYKAEIVKKIGGYRKGYEGSQDYDFVLRFTEQIDKDTVKHIPSILYHWRTIETSTAANSAAKPYAYDAAERSLNDALRRRGYKYELKRGNSFGTFNVIFKIENNPKVSIIIPTKDKINYLKKALKSIEAQDYRNIEVIIIDNNSKEPETKRFFDESKNEYKIITYNEIFNYAKINNAGAEIATGEHLLFLNNDIDLISSDWISRLLQYSQFKDTGFIGSFLLYPNKKIQHAGIIVNSSDQRIAHIFRGFDFYDVSFRGYMNAYDVVREVSAVTGACMMVKTSLFKELNGFDESFEVDANDIDICVRALKLGYSNIVNPYSLLYHYESLTRGKEKNLAEFSRYLHESSKFFQKHHDFIDPYLNENLITVFQKFEGI